MDLMIDFETLDTSADAVVLSVGIIVFDPTNAEIIRTFYLEFDVADQVEEEGRRISSSTIEWWLKTNPVEFLRLLSEGGNYLDFLRSELKDITSSYPIRKIWSRGHMDFEILCNICPGHFKYYQHADVRTLDALGFKMGKENNHNALDDCRNQLDYVTEVMSICYNTAQPAEDPSSEQSVQSVSTV